MADYETILTERLGNVLKITLNRPERLNAASIELAEDLTHAFYDLGDARCVLVTGAGKGFCSGADLAARGGVTSGARRAAATSRCRTTTTRCSTRSCAARCR